MLLFIDGNYKKKWNLIQAVKKCVAPKKVTVKKDVKSKVVAKKWLWWQVISKNFNNDNSGEFGAES